MNSLDVVVVAVLGLGLMVWELWYFLWPVHERQIPASHTLPQEFRVVVKDGFDPATVFVEVGRPVRLLFFRDETVACSERVVFDTLSIDEPLPPFHTTIVTFTPDAAGDYPFRCGESVMRGRVVAQVGREAARLNLGRGHTKHG